MTRFDKYCPVRKGDSLESVKSKLRLDFDPTPPGEDDDGRFYELKDKGISIFFDADDIVECLSFEAPFLGRIDGVAIGDSSKELVRIKGEPNRIWEDEVTGWLYDEEDFVRFNMDKSGKVIFIIS